MNQLYACLARRANYKRYLQDRVEDEDWHAAADAANDLRVLDAEIALRIKPPTRRAARPSRRQAR